MVFNMNDMLPPPSSASSLSSSTMHAKSGAEQAVMAREPPKSDVESTEKPNGDPLELKKTESAKKIQDDELNRVTTSDEGMEYPTGMKLGLICLALCLSVFLVALVSI